MTPARRMLKEPERQRHIAEVLERSKQRIGWFSDATAVAKLDSFLAHLFFDRPGQPWGLALIEADGTRRIIDRRLSVWAAPLFILVFGAALSLPAKDLATTGLSVLVFGVLAGVQYIKDLRTERHLLFDATRGLLVVHLGHRVLVEIPFDDIDSIFVATRADPSYIDRYFVAVSIGSVSLPLTWGKFQEDGANAAADALATLTGVVREREVRRVKPDT
jgi:hypothetical protein